MVRPRFPASEFAEIFEAQKDPIMVLTIEPADAVQEAEVSERERPRASGSLWRACIQGCGGR